jgi:carotenoid cleavage dioxygenase
MAEPSPADNSLLSGAFEPLRHEYDIEDLEIEGVLPEGLEGTLYRIGPNPQFEPIPPYNPLQGDGMIHAFRITNGKVSYRNRWVRTRQWQLERDAGRALFSTADPRLSDPSVRRVHSDGAANTNIVFHAGRLLALEEGHPPIDIDPVTLDTIGPYDFAGCLSSNMTAHPKIDPETGEFVFFSNFPDRSFDGAILVHIADRNGMLVRQERIAGPYPALVHDFAITREHIVFVISPLTLSRERLMRGAPPIAWEPTRGAFVGVIRRDDLRSVRWHRAPTAMVWHTLNAFEDGDAIHLDLCRADAAAFPDSDGVPPAENALRQYLARWTLGGDNVVEKRLSNRVCEYPRVDERYTGRPYRYGFVATFGGPGTGDLLHRGLGRFDHAAGEMQCWRAPDGHAVSEPVFAPRPNARDEGDGWLLTTIFDEQRNASHLAIFDATRLEAGPVTRAHLGHRVPQGFHGLFLAPQSS